MERLRLYKEVKRALEHPLALRTWAARDHITLVLLSKRRWWLPDCLMGSIPGLWYFPLGCWGECWQGCAEPVPKSCLCSSVIRQLKSALQDRYCLIHWCRNTKEECLAVYLWLSWLVRISPPKASPAFENSFCLITDEDSGFSSKDTHAASVYFWGKGS